MKTWVYDRNPQRRGFQEKSVPDLHPDHTRFTQK